MELRGIEPLAAYSFRYRDYVLAILVLMYTFNSIDRQIVGIVAVPIKQELGLPDIQLGLVGGLALALFWEAGGVAPARPRLNFRR